MQASNVPVYWRETYQAMLESRQQELNAALSLLGTKETLRGLVLLESFEDPLLAPQILPFVDVADASVRETARRILRHLRIGIPEVLWSYAAWEDQRLDDPLAGILTFPEYLDDWPPSLLLHIDFCGEVEVRYGLTRPLIVLWGQRLECLDRVNRLNALRLLKHLKLRDFKQQLLDCLSSAYAEVVEAALPLVWDLYRHEGAISDQEMKEQLLWLCQSSHATLRREAGGYLCDLELSRTRFDLVSGQRENILNQCFEQLLRDTDPWSRLEALRYGVPATPEIATHALEALLQTDQTTPGFFSQSHCMSYLDTTLAEKLWGWPESLHPVLWNLIRPHDPVPDLHKWLKALQVEPSNWLFFLEDWFSHELPFAKVAAIQACCAARLTIPETQLGLLMRDASSWCRIELCDYLIAATWLEEGSRRHYLSLLLQDPERYIAFEACSSLWGDDILLARDCLLSLPPESVLPGLIYMFERDSEIQVLSMGDYRELLALPCAQAAFVALLDFRETFLSGRKINAIHQRMQSGGGVLAPALIETVLNGSLACCDTDLARLIGHIPADQSCWRDGRTLIWLVHECKAVRVALLSRWCQIIRQMPDPHRMFELAAFLIRDPVWQIRQASVYLLGTSEAPESLPLIREALGDPCYQVRRIAIGMVARLSDRDAGHQLMRMVQQDELCNRYCAARVLRDWGVWQKGLPDWATQDNVPIALWEVLGLETATLLKSGFYECDPQCMELQDPFQSQLNIFGEAFKDPLET